MPRGTTAKSARTRAAIEAAARRLFAEQGFDRTTIRDVAAAAGADPALVIRYFGSKDELFACVAAPALGLPDIAEVDPARIGETLVAHFMDLWEGDGGLPVLLRSAASNPAAAEQLRGVFQSQVVPMIAAVGRRETFAVRAGLIASQLLGLAMTRFILQLPPVVALDRSTIVREVGKTVQRYVDLAEVEGA